MKKIFLKEDPDDLKKPDPNNPIPDPPTFPKP